jgi:hypothetical protein
LVLRSRNNPHDQLFSLTAGHLRDLQRVPYGVQFLRDGRISDFVSAAAPAAILENGGFGLK